MRLLNRRRCTFESSVLLSWLTVVFQTQTGSPLTFLILPLLRPMPPQLFNAINQSRWQRRSDVSFTDDITKATVVLDITNGNSAKLSV